MLGIKVRNKLTGHQGQVVNTEFAKNSDDGWVELYVVSMENGQVLHAPSTMWQLVEN